MDLQRIKDPSVLEGTLLDDKIKSTVPAVSEGDPNNNATAVSEGDSTLDDGMTESNITNTTTSNQTRDGYISQTRTR